LVCPVALGFFPLVLIYSTGEGKSFHLHDRFRFNPINLKHEITFAIKEPSLLRLYLPLHETNLRFSVSLIAIGLYLLPHSSFFSSSILLFPFSCLFFSDLETVLATIETRFEDFLNERIANGYVVLPSRFLLSCHGVSLSSLANCFCPQHLCSLSGALSWPGSSARHQLSGLRNGDRFDADEAPPRACFSRFDLTNLLHFNVVFSHAFFAFFVQCLLASLHLPSRRFLRFLILSMSMSNRWLFPYSFPPHPSLVHFSWLSVLFTRSKFRQLTSRRAILTSERTRSKFER
jgi:hypothetical protein